MKKFPLYFFLFLLSGFQVKAEAEMELPIIKDLYGVIPDKKSEVHNKNYGVISESNQVHKNHSMTAFEQIDAETKGTNLDLLKSDIQSDRDENNAVSKVVPPDESLLTADEISLNQVSQFEVKRPVFVDTVYDHDKPPVPMTGSSSASDITRTNPKIHAAASHVRKTSPYIKDRVISRNITVFRREGVISNNSTVSKIPEGRNSILDFKTQPGYVPLVDRADTGKRDEYKAIEQGNSDSSGRIPDVDSLVKD